MPPTTVTGLYEIAQDVLEVAEEALGTTTAGVPARSYVSPAEPAYDCEQLTVHVAGLFEAGTSPQAPSLAPGKRRKLGNVILVTYNVLVLRCGPYPESDGSPPPAAEYELASAKVLEDGWALWNYFHQEINCERLFETCLGAIFDGGLPIREQGGIVGWRFVLRAMLEGMEVDCA